MNDLYQKKGWSRAVLLLSDILPCVVCLMETLFSCNSESITAPHDHSTASICFVHKFDGLCFHVGCHVFRNRQRII